MSAPIRLDPAALPRTDPAVKRATAAPPQALRGDASFAGMLEGMIEGRGSSAVRFSAHAQQRMASRNLRLDPSQEAGVARALDQAASKGARESLLVLDGMSLVVSVPNRTVITAVPHGEAGDAVFTHIDSAVVVSKDAAAASQ